MKNQISPHFKRSEFTCRCGCGKDTVDAELITVLEQIRNYFNRPVVVTSGYRCPARNEAVGGAHGSMHMEGKAADIQVAGVYPSDVVKFAEQVMPNGGGIGIYETWTHVDVRDSKARW